MCRRLVNLTVSQNAEYVIIWNQDKTYLLKNPKQFAFMENPKLKAPVKYRNLQQDF